MEGGILICGFINAKCFHDAERGGALERSRKGTIPVEKSCRCGPSLHLRGIQEKATGVRIRPALKGEWGAEEFGFKRAAITDILPSGREVRPHRAIDVELVERLCCRQLEPMRQQQRLVAEGPREPPGLGQKIRITNQEVVLHVAIVVVFTEVRLEDLMAREAKHHRIGGHRLVVEHCLRDSQTVHEMLVRHRAHGDIDQGGSLPVDLHQSAVPTSGHRIVHAVEECLARAEMLVDSGDRRGKRLRPPRALGSRGAIRTISRSVVEMRNSDEDFQWASELLTLSGVNLAHVRRWKKPFFRGSNAHLFPEGLLPRGWHGLVFVTCGR